MIEALRELDIDGLRHLAEALRSARLGPRYTPLAIERFAGHPLASTLSSAMQRLADEGMRREHLALLLEAVALERQRAREAADTVEVVMTGPEAAGVATRDTAVVVRELFAAAREHAVVVGYAVHRGREVFKALADRMDERPGLSVKLFLDVRRSRSECLTASETVARFAAKFRTDEWPGRRLPELYYDPRSLEPDAPMRASLHAKCVVVDREVAFVSSANFTQAAQSRNVEVGVLIRSPALATKLANHFESLAQAERLKRVLL